MSYVLLIDHLYDSGPTNTHGPCIFAEYYGDGRYAPECGEAEHMHEGSEYDTAANRYEDPTPGDMHEPEGYPADELDWGPRVADRFDT